MPAGQWQWQATEELGSEGGAGQCRKGGVVCRPLLPLPRGPRSEAGPTTGQRQVAEATLHLRVRLPEKKEER